MLKSITNFIAKVENQEFTKSYSILVESTKQKEAFLKLIISASLLI